MVTFPDVERLTDFLFGEGISNVIVNTRSCSVQAQLTDEQIFAAGTSYQGRVAFPQLAFKSSYLQQQIPAPAILYTRLWEAI